MGTLAFQGSLAALPDGDVFRPLDVRVPLALPAEVRSVPLAADAPVAVNLAAFGNVHVLLIEADFPVVAAFTSAAGTAQAVPGEIHFLVSRASPITALSLTRVAGQATMVRLTLGQGA